MKFVTALGLGAKGMSQSINLDLAPGSMVFPRMKTLGTNNFNMNVYWVINYCKKPL